MTDGTFLGTSTLVTTPAPLDKGKGSRMVTGQSCVTVSTLRLASEVYY